MKKQVVARAPGKLIISGEYSVLVGMPAISFAIDDFTEVTASLTNDSCISIELNDYGLKARLSWDEVHLRYLGTRGRYSDFLAGLLPIEKVLECPIDLCCFTVEQILNIPPSASSQRKLGFRPNPRESGEPDPVREIGSSGQARGLGLDPSFRWDDARVVGLKLSINSSIPISSGFGSSAALIVGLLKALDALLCLNLTEDGFYKIALEAENLVHGTSSGMDIRTAIKGGWNYFNIEDAKTSNTSFEFFTIFTGKPESSTGQSIANVRGRLEASKHSFNEVTLKLKEAFEIGDYQASKEQIKKNHLLLSSLGVVPRTVQKFIAEVEEATGAAKVCGAGAVSGENAGAVLALGDFNAISEIANRYGYKVRKVTPSERGAYVLQD